MPVLVRRVLLAPVLVLALSVPLAAAPQWTSLGPFGGNVERLTVDPVDPQVLYASLGAQGTFKSADRGASWIPIHAGAAASNVVVDPTRNTTIYQTVTPGQVLKSTDGGAHWSASSVPGFPQVGELAVDPAAPNRIYLATGEGVWHSLDGGASWQPGRRPLPPGGPQSVKALLALARPTGTVFAGTEGGLFQSADGGDTWKPAGRGLHAGAVTLLARTARNGVLWDNVKGFGIYWSVNGGASWRRTAAQPKGATNVTALAVPPSPAGTVWASSVGNGIYRTTDSGAHWAPAGLRPNASVLSLAFGGSTLYAGLLTGNFDVVGRDTGGVYASTDGGATWRSRNLGLAGLIVDVALDPRDGQVLWATTGDSGLFRSTVGGFDWDFPTQPEGPVTANPTSRTVFGATFAADGSALYVVSSHRLWKTVDDGASWHEVGPVNPSFFITNDFATDPGDPRTLYVPSGSSLYTSHDAGASWQSQPIPMQCFLISLAAAAASPATLYAGGADGRGDCNQQSAALYRSTDGGATWAKADAGLSADPANFFVRSVAVDPADARTLYAGAYQSPAVWKSTDGGATWTRIDTGLNLQSVPVLSVSPADGSVWATDGFQVIVSRDAGAVWESVGAPQSNLLFDVGPDPRDASRVYVTGWGGVWLLELAPP
ncbi:MAG TPA: hypothetical protein VF173_30520 [Thermoanaerobaculia bacterium]|nr:hypothetical protein [Thermoanaerobaculia bacterium]